MLERLFCFLLLNLGFIYSGFPQSSIIAKLRAEFNNYPGTSDTGLVNILNSLSTEYTFVKPDSTIYFAGKSRQIAHSINFSLGEVRAIANLAKAYYVKGSYDLSLSYTLRAKSISEKINDKFGLAFVYNNIGLIHLTQNKVRDGIKVLLTALNLAIDSKNINIQAAVYLNLGIAYAEIKQHAIALKYLEIGLDHSKKHKLHTYAVMILNRLAENYYKIKQFEKAIEYYQYVLSYQDFRSDWEHSFAYSGIARIELERGNSAVSIGHAKKALHYAKLVNAKYDISRSLQILYAAYAEAGDYKNAFESLELEKLYRDSLFNEAKEKEINRLNLEQKIAENRKLLKLIDQNKEQIRINELIIRIVAGLAVFLLILTILVFRYYRQKSKLNMILVEKSEQMEIQNELIRDQNMQLGHLNKTKDQLFSIIGHDLRSPFGNMLQLMDLMRSGIISEEELRGFLDDFYEKVSDMSYMLDNLVSWAGSQQQGIKPRPVNIILYDQVEPLLKMFKSQIKEKRIKLIHTGIADTHVYGDPDHVLIIIRNLLVNAIKFTPAGGSISISYSSGAGSLSIHIKDSGVGMSSEKIRWLFKAAGKEISTHGTDNEKGTGIGLLLVKQFADENGIGIEVCSEEQKGTEFVLHFKRTV
ncbi:ATP-binding protein [Daejeonella sp. H1SJ63]|uniref:ATP-binding protein n=1 Tax=Daejeonella sp. H1SJ63 TaxID=3034145 RepID=UPI0023ECE5D5|nr:ATP-binding protein [Daejeonella sp. H1SJ63]